MIIQVISGIGGSIPLFKSGCLDGSGRSGIGIASHLRRSARQRYSPRQCRVAEMRYPQAVSLLFEIQLTGQAQVTKHDAFGLKLFIQWALGKHEAWAHGPGGPRACLWTKGLGSWAYHWAEDQGPSNPGDPYTIQLRLGQSRISILYKKKMTNFA